MMSYTKVIFVYIDRATALKSKLYVQDVAVMVFMKGWMIFCSSILVLVKMSKKKFGLMVIQIYGNTCYSFYKKKVLEKYIRPKLGSLKRR